MDTKENVVLAPTPEQPAPKKKKRKKKKIVKRVIATVIILAILGGIAYGLYSLFKEPEEGEKEILPGFVYTLSASGTVQEVFVEEGMWVNEGDPLYIIDSTEAREAVEAAKETVDNYQEQMDALLENQSNLNITAPYAGKLMEVSEAQPGDNIGTGTKIAMLVDDSLMDLTLYFSYAYQTSIYVGQPALVTVPSSMTQTSGSVKEISYVDYVSAEGGRFFEVVLSVPNPGSLTEGTAASAQLTADDGSAIYPYDAGTFKFSRKTDILSKVHGEILSVHLKNHLRVSEGALLMQVSAEDLETEIATLKTTMQTAQEKLTEAQDRLGAFEAFAPMSGTVLSCALQPGQEVSSGFTAISIADTSVMTVTAPSRKTR